VALPVLRLAPPVGQMSDGQMSRVLNAASEPEARRAHHIDAKHWQRTNGAHSSNVTEFQKRSPDRFEFTPFVRQCLASMWRARWASDSLLPLKRALKPCFYSRADPAGTTREPPGGHSRASRPSPAKAPARRSSDAPYSLAEPPPFDATYRYPSTTAFKPLAL
jgi:hypothetical protein